MGNEINPKAMAVALAAVTFLMDLAGYVYHGLMQQPSMVNLLYPGFWSSPALMAYGLIGTLAMALAFGYIFAVAYNYLLRRLK
ncbi:MAG: hypothetical protein HY362_04555 [Candidatus Aenigmarchaeota archaeon]|nr:hypothetical protein [Candidatus Aenigmarchaeota archaeon]